MRIEQLVYLVEIAKYQSISLAAENLHISQPTISYAILKLEEELGKKLFTRLKYGTIPTDDGQKILQYAKEILGKIEEIKYSADPNSNQLTGTLNLASVPSLCTSLLPKALVIFNEKFPGVTINLLERGSIEIEQNVLNREFDLGFIITDSPVHYDDQKFQYTKLFLSHLIAYVGSKSPLNGNISTTFSEISKYPIVVSNQSGYRIFNTIANHLRKFNDATIILHSGNLAAAKHIVSEGVGVGFASKLNTEYDLLFNSKRIVPLTITDTNTNLNYYMIHLKSRYLTTASKQFIKILKSLVESK